MDKTLKCIKTYCMLNNWNHSFKCFKYFEYWFNDDLYIHDCNLGMQALLLWHKFCSPMTGVAVRGGDGPLRSKQLQFSVQSTKMAPNDTKQCHVFIMSTTWKTHASDSPNNLNNFVTIQEIAFQSSEISPGEHAFPNSTHQDIWALNQQSFKLLIQATPLPRIYSQCFRRR